MINHSLLLAIIMSSSAIAMEEPSLNKLATNEILTILRPKNTLFDLHQRKKNQEPPAVQKKRMKNEKNLRLTEEKFRKLKERRKKLLVGKTVVFHQATIPATSKANQTPASVKVHQAKADSVLQ